LKVLESRAPVEAGLFRLAIASHYPQASEALSGSVAGSLCHLSPKLEEELSTFLRKEFTALFFESSTLTGAVIVFLAVELRLEAIEQSSKAAGNAAAALMQRAHLPTTPELSDSEGMWAHLDEIENIAERKMRQALAGFDKAFAACAEAGILAPNLGKPNKTSDGLRLSAIFLKRVLNDLRGVLLMLNRGYTSQAAAVAASLFENALAVNCICPSEAAAAQVFTEFSGELRWNVANMCKMTVAASHPEGKETGWENLYAQYVWLCQIKHPTLAQAKHDAGSTSVDGKAYTVMPMPDLRVEDEPVKTMVGVSALHNALNAVRCFSKAVGAGDTAPREKAYSKKIDQVSEFLTKFLKRTPRILLPFTIQRSKWVQKQMKLSQHKNHSG
jgi:hypothetical protein